ncbi:D-2-hydroxyacid dehydrogenase [Chloroflexota bacterium]
MEMVNILVTRDIGEELLDSIRAISPRVKLWDVTDLVREEREENVTLSELDVVLAEAEVMFGLTFPKNVTARAPRLKWIQVAATGIDSMDPGTIAGPATVTNARGMHETSVSEYALALMLAFVKQLPSILHFQQSKQWERLTPSMLRSRTVGVVGLGRIGREVARLSRAFGMRVIATRRSATEGRRARNVDVLLPPEKLRQLLRESDFVVLCVPLTAENEKMLGEAELRAMKPTAYLINVARGQVTDEDAVVRALREKWITGAGVDVFGEEPLPPDSPLWDAPNIILSAHVSGRMADYDMRATELFCENLKRYLNGKRLINVVDKKKGY